MQEMVGSVAEMLQRYQTALDAQEQRTKEACTRAAWKEILETLIDMRDRLSRGSQTARSWLARPEPVAESGLLKRIRDRFIAPRPADRDRQREEVVRSLLKGYTLCQEVLDEALGRIGVRPMDCCGRTFDPVTMKAVDIEHKSEAPGGTVLEIYRQGYWWGETAYRPAEVKVAAEQEQTHQNEKGMFSGQGGQNES
jgi:hypothetical protein